MAAAHSGPSQPADIASDGTATKASPAPAPSHAELVDDEVRRYIARYGGGRSATSSVSAPQPLPTPEKQSRQPASSSDMIDVSVSPVLLRETLCAAPSADAGSHDGTLPSFHSDAALHAMQRWWTRGPSPAEPAAPATAAFSVNAGAVLSSPDRSEDSVADDSWADEAHASLALPPRSQCVSIPIPGRAGKVEVRVAGK